MVFNLINWVANISNPLLNPILRPLLDPLPQSWAIIIIAFFITLITTLAYKKFTNQEVLKSLKQEIKDIQAEMKEFSHDVQRTAELQKQSWQKMAQQFKQSMKPMFITWIPILIIFAWVWTNLAYLPISPGEEFTTTIEFEKGITGKVEIIPPEKIQLLEEPKKDISEKKVSWRLKGEKGEYALNYKFKDEIYSKELIITDKKVYIPPKLNVFDDNVRTIEVNNSPVKIFGLNWFWGYLIFSMVVSMILRKLLRVH